MSPHSEPRAVHIMGPIGGLARPLAARAGDTVAEIIAANGVPLRMPTVAVLLEDGKEPDYILRADWTRRAVAPHERLALVALPAGGDGGGKNILRAVLLIAVIAAAVAFGPQLAALVGFEGTFAAAVAQTAIAVAGTTLVNAILPPPQPSLGGFRGLPEASPTYSLRAQGNAARLGNPIPRLYGRHRFFPDYASAPWQEYSGNDQFLNQLFCLTLGDLEVEEIGIEDTALWTAAGGYTGNFEDVAVEVVPPFTLPTLFPADVETSAEVGAQEFLAPDAGGDWLGPFVANDAASPAIALAVDYALPRGLYVIDKKNGKILTTGVNLDFEYRAIDAAGAAIGAWQTLGTPGHLMGSTTPQRFSVRADVPAGRYEVRARRTNIAEIRPDAVDQAFWVGLRAYLAHETDFGNVTLLAVRMRANEQLSARSSNRFYVIGTGKVETFDGAVWSTPVATRNPIWAALDIVRADYGGALSDSRLALTAFRDEALAAAARGDAFDAVIDRKTTLWAAIADALRPARAQPVLLGDTVFLVRDQPQAIPKAVFTPRNIIRGSFSTEYVLFDSDSPDDVVATYWDEDLWRPMEVRASPPGSLSQTPGRMELFGFTKRQKAYEWAWYQAQSNALRRKFFRFRTEWDGRLLTRGALILIAHDIGDWGQSGAVLARAGATLSLDREVGFTPGAEHYLWLRKRDGSAWGPVLATAGLEADEVDLDTDDLAAVENAQGALDGFLVTDGSMEETAFIFGPMAAQAQEALVVSMVPRGEEVEILAVNEDTLVHAYPGAAPPLTVAGALTVADGPAVASLDLALVAWGSPQVTLEAAWPPAPGADEYVLQASFDDGASWATVQVSAATRAVFAVPAGAVRARVAGIGRVRGPFVEASGLFDQAALVPAPTGLLVAEELYETTGSAGVKARAVITWTASAATFPVTYEARWRALGDDAYQTAAAPVSPFILTDLAPGPYEIGVRAVGAGQIGNLRAESDWTSVSVEIFGLAAPPAEPQGLTILGISGIAVLRWQRAGDLDVRIGGAIEIRHSPLLSGATWAGSVTIGDPVNGDETLAMVPLKAGTYLLKTRDSSGVMSLGTALASTKGITLAGYGNIATITEDAAFAGAMTDVVAVDGALRLAGGGFTLDDVGTPALPAIATFDAIPSLDRFSGIALSGIYEFATGFDFGAVEKRRLRTDMVAFIVNVNDTIDSRTGTIDTWPSFDGTADAPADAIIEFAETDDDPSGSPTWGPWHRLDVAEIEAWGAKIRLRLMTGSQDYNVLVSELRVHAEELT